MPENVVGDPTDPRETLRPNLHPEIGTGDHYEPLFCPEFNRIINLPLSADRTDPITIWSLFFTQESLKNIAQNTNKKGASLYNNQGKHGRPWTDIDICELYAYLAILFYMGLHIENDTRLYWSHKEGNPVHIAVHRAIGENRWHHIYFAFSILDPTLPLRKTVFKKVS